MRLSIVTTMYNSAKYLPKCVDSLLNQDLPTNDYEIILVNDGSPDNSLEIAEQYASRYKNIKVLSHANKGLAGARNTGLEVASGEYLCFVDPDDYVHPNVYGRLLGVMDDEQLDILRFNYEMVNEDYQVVNKPKGTMIDYSPQIMDGETFLCERLGYGCFVWAYVYRLSFLRKNNVSFEEKAYFDDTNWLPNVCCRAKRIDSLDQVCYFYTQREGSLLNTNNESAKKKKLAGQLDLVRSLMSKSENIKTIKVKRWYRSMISMTMLSILSDSVENGDIEAVKAVNTLRAFPLKADHVRTMVKVKMALANVSPFLFYYLMKLVGK